MKVALGQVGSPSLSGGQVPTANAVANALAAIDVSAVPIGEQITALTCHRDTIQRTKADSGDGTLEQSVQNCEARLAVLKADRDSKLSNEALLERARRNVEDFNRAIVSAGSRIDVAKAAVAAAQAKLAAEESFVVKKQEALAAANATIARLEALAPAVPAADQVAPSAVNAPAVVAQIRAALPPEASAAVGALLDLLVPLCVPTPTPPAAAVVVDGGANGLDVLPEEEGEEGMEEDGDDEDVDGLDPLEVSARVAAGSANPEDLAAVSGWAENIRVRRVQATTKKGLKGRKGAGSTAQPAKATTSG